MDGPLRDLTNNAAPLLALVIVHSALLPRLRHRQPAAIVSLGLLFGATAVIGMAFPFELRPGLFFDSRSVVLALAGFFGGPVVALVAGALAAACRVWLGGSGLWMGLGVIATATLMGAAGYRLRQAGKISLGLTTCFSLGLLVHLFALPWMLALPSGDRAAFLDGVAVPFLGILTLSTWLFGLAFQIGESREQARREAREAEDRFRSLVESSQVGVYMIQDGHFVYANPALEAIFGYPPGGLVGLPASVPVLSEDREVVAEQVRRRETGEIQSAHYVFRAQRADGQVFEAEVFGTRTRRGGRTAIVGMLFDVTRREAGARRLAESERLLREAQQAGRIGSFALDIPKMGWSASPMLDEIFGIDEHYPRTLKGWLELIAPEQRSEMARYAQRVLGTGERFDREYAIVRPDGSRRWLYGLGTVECDADGRPQRMVGIVQDITERKTAQDAARNSEQRFRSLVEAIPDLVWLKDASGTYLVCNPPFARFVGSTVDDITGRTDRDLLPAAQAELFQANDQAAVAAGRAVATEESLAIAHEGREIVAEVIRAPLLDRESGALIGVLGVARDITARREAENALAREVASARMMLETMSDGYLRLDWEGRILDTNPAYCRMVGFAREELVGRRLEDFKTPGREHEVRERIHTIVRKGRLRFLTRHRHKDGHFLDIEASVASMPDAQPPQLTGFYRDVTRERQMSLHYDELVNRIPAGVFRYRATASGGRFEFVSPAFCALLGIDAASALRDPETVFACLHEDDAARFNALRGQSRAQSVPFAWEGRVNADAGVRWLRVEAGVVTTAEGDLVWHGVVSDVTERQQMIERLRLDSAVIASTFESIMITDLDANIVSVNPAFSDLTGYAAEEVIGRNARLLRSGRHDPSFYQGMYQALREVGHWQGQIWNRRKSGESYLELLNISVVRDAAGEPSHYVGVATDITQIKRSEERLHYLAHHDALTGLPNRLMVSLRLEHALEHARREGTESAVLFLDLDRFKTVNDSLGHATGDELLIAVAKRMRSVLREEDTIGRLGGDEFVILLERLADSMAAAKVAQLLLGAFSQPFALDSGHELYIETSIGISLYPSDGDRADLLIRNADTAMFRAKEQGRNTYQFYTEALTQAASGRLVMETRIRHALRDRAFQVWYQPIYRFAERRIVGAEALVRWQAEDGSMVSPDLFVPVAEDSGLIIELGREVLRTACADLRAWNDQGLRIETLAINLSPQQFRVEHFERVVEHDITAARVSPKVIELELTERGLMDLGRETLDKLHALKALGVRLAIDDFGTGYSSLTYLKRMPVDKLKIDRSFVDHVTEDASDAAIVATILAIARTLGLRVLAEGVETQAQFDYLRDAGCDECQGFFFGPAVPAVRFAEQFRGQGAPGASRAGSG